MSPENITKPDSSKENSFQNEISEKQQQTDPQVTELKGFFDKDEKLEPNADKDGKVKDQLDEK